jgi:hypothetical protein
MWELITGYTVLLSLKRAKQLSTVAVIRAFLQRAE